MSRTIDLDAARRAREAARAEANDEAVTIVFGGETFTLPAELPLEAASAAGDPLRFVEAILGDSYTAFMAHRPSIEDVTVLAEGIAASYGFADVGESSASSAS